MTKYQRLLKEALDAARAAKAIAAKAEAEGRQMTDGEIAEYNAKTAEMVSSHKAAAVARADEEVLAQAKALVEAVDGPPARRRKGGSEWAHKSAETVLNAMPGPVGQKAVVSGTIRLANPVAGIVPLGRVPLTVLDLIGGTVPADGNTFTFLKQTTRTNNAAPVADAGAKPTSVYTITEVEDRLRVIAHLSEPMPQRYLADYGDLETFLADDMEFGIRMALEAQIVSGVGTGENMTGILNTSGIIAQAAVPTDLIATLRKAVTAMQVSGGTPGAFVLNPADAEKVDLLREGTGTGTYLMGGPGSATDQTLWNIPRVASTSIAAGTALLGDFEYVDVVTKDQVEIAIDTSGTNFTSNQAVMRVEGRFGIAVKRPSAFVKITLP